MNDFRPLYARVQEMLVSRLMGREWAPGAMIPSETALAKEIGVSQGTVRKAIDQLCADGILTRAQGRGTFVAEQTPERANFRFLRLQDDQGNQIVPDLVRQIASSHAATDEQAVQLGLAPGDTVHVIDRVRAVDGRKAILETVVVPDAIMPGFSAEPSMPNALYPYYQAKFGITVVSTDDRIGADMATARQARMLSISKNAALVRVDRKAKDLTGQVVELRVSHFLTDGFRYVVSLR